jgi:predicted glycoside hydrolase/deacetylase ChbG (UPF0249 family)
MIRLVVNAEGFGDSTTTNDAILRAHRDGIVTSTAVVGNCADITGVARTLGTCPDLGVGLSLALIQGTPVAPAAEVASLLTPAGTLRARAAELAVEWVRGHVRPEHVERELEAQLQRARAAGLDPDHLSTRGHVGLLPGIAEIVERLARRHGIAGLRSTVEPPTLAWVADARRGLETGVLAGLAWLSRRRLGPLRHGPRSWGYLDAGRLDEVRILEIIGRLGPGAHELICHPGDQASRGDAAAPDELEALTSLRIRTALDRRDIQLTRWRDLF